MRRCLQILVQVVVTIACFCDRTAASPNAPSSPAAIQIVGHVREASSGTDVAACSVYVAGMAVGTATDTNGTYRLSTVPIGNIELVAERVGYVRQVTQLRIDSIAIYSVDISLTQSNEPLPPVHVSGNPILPTPSAIPQFRIEFGQIRSNPGAIGDAGRALLSLPSTGRVHDNASDLVVRGGSPVENAYYIDDIPVPNVNHFPVQGSTAGAVTMIGNDLIGAISLQPGGYPTAYENAVSSVVEMRLREGSRTGTSARVDASLIGVSGALEGNLAGDQCRWIVGARRSHLDLLVDVLNTPEVPSFSDAQTKLVLDISKAHSFTFLGLFGDSKLALSKERAEEKDYGSYGDFHALQLVNGLRWRWSWGTAGASTTTLSFSRVHSEHSTSWTYSEYQYYLNNSDDREVTVRNTAVHSYGNHTIETGAVVSRLRSTQEFATGHYYTSDGDEIEPIAYDRVLWQTSAGAFASHSWSLSPRFSVSVGFRVDYSDLQKKLSLSPRVSTRWSPLEDFSIHAAVGEYHQNLPSFLLLQTSDPGLLSPLDGFHSVLGIRWDISPLVGLSIDGYVKRLAHFPLDATRPDLFVVDDATSLQGFNYYPGLYDGGNARARGVELMLEYRSLAPITASVSLALSKSEFQTEDLRWYERSFNNRLTMNASLKYTPSPRWAIDIRWAFSGGTPYTPFDVEKSEWYGVGILDTSRIQSEHLPEYHALHLRAEYRWSMHGSQAQLSFGVMNAYNRDNVAYYYWRFSEGAVAAESQWRIMPVFGLRLEF